MAFQSLSGRDISGNKFFGWEIKFLLLFRSKLEAENANKKFLEVMNDKLFKLVRSNNTRHKWLHYSLAIEIDVI